MKALKLATLGVYGAGLGLAYAAKVASKGDPAKQRMADQAIEMGKNRVKRAIELLGKP